MAKRPLPKLDDTLFATKEQKQENEFKLSKGKLLASEEERFNRPPFASVKQSVDEDTSVLCIEYFKENPDQLKARDCVGATPFLMAVLERRFRLAELMIKEFKDKVLRQIYSDGPYRGESALHIAIVMGNRDFVKLLLEEDKTYKVTDEIIEQRLTRTQAMGEFFGINNPCGFGEYPLYFAACMGDKDIFSDVLEADKEVLKIRDSHGNNVLHILVHRSLPKAFVDVVNVLETTDSGIEEVYNTLCDEINSDNLSPVSLAASLGHQKMFAKIISMGKKDIWEFGPIKATGYPVKFIIPDENHVVTPEGAISALQAMVDNHQVDFIKIPFVKKVIMYIWNNRTKRIFITRLWVWLLLATIYTASVFCNKDQETCPATASYVLYTLVLFGVVYKSLRESIQLYNMGPRAYFNETGVGRFENLDSLAFCILTILGIVSRYTVFAWAEKLLFSLASITVWAYGLFFCMGFQLTGPFVIMMFRMIEIDILRFLLLYATLWMGVSTAIYTVSTTSLSLSYVMLNTFFSSLGAFDLSTFTEEGGAHNTFVTFLLICWLLTSAVLLLNLLIAMMGKTIDQILEYSEGEWILEVMGIIISIENEHAYPWQRKLFPWMRKSRPEGAEYWITLEGRPYFVIETHKRDEPDELEDNSEE